MLAGEGVFALRRLPGESLHAYSGRCVQALLAGGSETGHSERRLDVNSGKPTENVMATAKKKSKAARKPKRGAGTTAAKAAATELNPAMLRWMRGADADGKMPARSRSDTMRRCINAGFVNKVDKSWLLTDTGKAVKSFFDQVAGLLKSTTFPLPRALARLLA